MTLINLKPDKKPNLTEPTFTDIEAGSTKAKFILASVIDYDLETMPEEKVVEIAPGIKAIKKKDGLVQLLPINTMSLTPARRDSITGLVNATIRDVKKAVITIKTPRGGENRIGLPDGTALFLNAASTLTFAVDYHEMPERRVHLTGEAFFRVYNYRAKNKETGKKYRVPFIVHAGHQEVRSIGTEFCINNYNNENVVLTTLRTGSAEVSTANGSVILKRGMQSVSDKERLVIRDEPTV